MPVALPSGAGVTPTVTHGQHAGATVALRARGRDRGQLLAACLHNDSLPRAPKGRAKYPGPSTCPGSRRRARLCRARTRACVCSYGGLAARPRGVHPAAQSEHAALDSVSGSVAEAVAVAVAAVGEVTPRTTSRVWPGSRRHSRRRTRGCTKNWRHKGALAGHDETGHAGRGPDADCGAAQRRVKARGREGWSYNATRAMR